MSSEVVEGRCVEEGVVGERDVEEGGAVQAEAEAAEEGVVAEVISEEGGCRRRRLFRYWVRSEFVDRGGVMHVVTEEPPKL